MIFLPDTLVGVRQFLCGGRFDAYDNVNTEVLVKICLALNCDIGDIAEIILPEQKQGE